MSGLTLGLLGVSAKLAFGIALSHRLSQVIWALCTAACALMLWQAAPGFADVTFWGLAAAGIWALDREGAKAELLFASLAGMLIAGSAPFVGAAADAALAAVHIQELRLTAPDQAIVGRWAMAFVLLAAVTCGAVLAGLPGGAMGLVSACLGQGGVDPLILGMTVSALAVLIAGFAGAHRRLGLAMVLLVSLFPIFGVPPS